MAHCCNEALGENTKCRSSQLADESTAQTVMIKYIASLAWTPGVADRIHNSISYETGGARFH
jgi:hypothetical protein